MSYKVQGCDKTEHRNMGAVFLRLAHTHMVCLHVSQEVSYPLAGSSFMFIQHHWSLDFLCHSLDRTMCAGKYDSYTLVKKPFLDF